MKTDMAGWQYSKPKAAHLQTFVCPLDSFTLSPLSMPSADEQLAPTLDEWGHPGSDATLQ